MKNFEKPKTLIHSDNFDALRKMDGGSVDFIYLDPQYKTNKKQSNADGSAEYLDKFNLGDRERGKYLDHIKRENCKLYSLLIEGGHLHTKYDGYQDIIDYLIFHSPRIVEYHRVLKDSGNVCIHCNMTMYHPLLEVFDCVFGWANRKDDIIWNYTDKQTEMKGIKKCPAAHDKLTIYGKTKNTYFERVYIDMDKNSSGMSIRNTGYKLRTIPGIGGKRVECIDVYNWKKFKAAIKAGKVKDYDVKNRKIRDLSKKQVPQKTLTSVWVINSARMKNKYPTEKPELLIEYLIRAYSPKKGLVVDPFCGSGTTAVVATKLDRRWICVDNSFTAYKIAETRIQKIDIEFGYTEGEIEYLDELPNTNRDDSALDTKKPVYLMRSINNPRAEKYRKVGFSKNPRDRAFDIDGQGFETTLEVVYEIPPTKHYAQIEREMKINFPIAKTKMGPTGKYFPTEWRTTVNAERIDVGEEGMIAKLIELDNMYNKQPMLIDDRLHC